MALLTHVQLVACCKSRSFLQNLFRTNPSDCFYICLQWITFKFLRLFTWYIYSPSQLHVICKLNKYTPFCIIQIIRAKKKVLNRTGARTDLFQAVLSMLFPYISENKTLISKFSSLSSSQVCIQDWPVVPQQDTKAKMFNSHFFICKVIILL